MLRIVCYIALVSSCSALQISTSGASVARQTVQKPALNADAVAASGSARRRAFTLAAAGLLAGSASSARADVVSNPYAKNYVERPTKAQLSEADDFDFFAGILNVIVTGAFVAVLGFAATTFAGMTKKEIAVSDLEDSGRYYKPPEKDMER